MNLRTVVVVAVVIAGAGCSKNAGFSAETYIVEELQDQIAMGPLDAECGQPAAYEAGEMFDCTATAEDGRVVTLVGTMTDSDTFDLTTTNLLSADAVGVITARVADAVTEQVGTEVTAAEIACEEGPILLDDAGKFRCEITDPLTGEVFGILISTGGLDSDGNLRTLDYQIGTQTLDR